MFPKASSGFHCWPPSARRLRGWLPAALLELLASLSFLTHFDAIKKGVLDLRDVVYFLAMIGFWLYASAIVIDLKKAD